MKANTMIRMTIGTILAAALLAGPACSKSDAQKADNAAAGVKSAGNSLESAAKETGTVVKDSASSAAQMTRFDAKPGAKVRIEGSSNIHDWQVEGKIIGGYMEVGKGFPTEPGAAAAPGKVDAKVEAFIPVKSLSSIKEDGSPYMTSMDDIMYGKLKFAEQPKIYYRLTELTLKEAAKSKEAPYVFDAVGELAAAGVTNKISMPVNITPLGEGKLKVTGTVKTKMSDFKIEPPAPAVAGGLIKTEDAVTLKIDWTVAQRKTATAAK